MKKPNLSQWRNPDELEGLIFFAQAFDELLFDHTMDKYRVPALNSHFIVLEFLLVAADVERGELQRGSLEPVAQELTTQVRACPVMAEILKPDIEWHLSAIMKASKNTRTARDHARRILDIVDSRYLEELKRQLTQAVRNGHAKERLYKLTRCLVCELINRGYSPKHLYFTCRRHFFGAHEVRSNAALEEFLSLFDFKKTEFTIVLAGSPTFRLTAPYSGIANTVILEEAPAPLTEHPSEVTWLTKRRDDRTRFLKLSGIDAVDPQTAAFYATEHVRMLADLTMWHVHRERLAWEEEMLVIKEESKQVQVVKPPKLSVHKRPDVQQEGRLSSAVQRFAGVILESKLSARANSCFMRSSRMHADAVRSEQVTTQFVYLWTAVETLTPRDHSKARIKVFLDFMLPYLCGGYTVKLIHDLGKGLESQDREVYLNVLHSAAGGESRVEKLGAILSLGGEQEKREKLLAMCTGNPLLRYRTFRLSETLSSAKEIEKMLRRHETRVAQHVQRMYRVRNMILHTGSTMPYMTTLVENLHEYIDRIVSGIIRECGPFPSGHRDIDAVTDSVRRRYEAQMDTLNKTKDVEVTLDNFGPLIFGPQRAR